MPVPLAGIPKRYFVLAVALWYASYLGVCASNETVGAAVQCALVGGTVTGVALGGTALVAYGLLASIQKARRGGGD